MEFAKMWMQFINLKKKNTTKNGVFVKIIKKIPQHLSQMKLCYVLVSFRGTLHVRVASVRPPYCRGVFEQHMEAVLYTCFLSVKRTDFKMQLFFL